MFGIGECARGYGFFPDKQQNARYLAESLPAVFWYCRGATAKPGYIDGCLIPVPAANLGPFPSILVADWLADRVNGKPLANEHWYVRNNGQIEKKPL